MFKFCGDIFKKVHVASYKVAHRSLSFHFKIVKLHELQSKRWIDNVENVPRLFMVDKDDSSRNSRKEE